LIKSSPVARTKYKRGSLALPLLYFRKNQTGLEPMPPCVLLEKLTACKIVTKQLQSYCPREINTEKEVGTMFFFSCNNSGNTGCNSIWQLLSQLCGGFGC